MNISLIIRLFTGEISIITENRCSGNFGYQNFRTFHRIWQVIDSTLNTLHVYYFVYQQSVFTAM